MRNLLANSTPVDKTARLVIAQNGEHWSPPELIGGRRTFAAPPKSTAKNRRMNGKYKGQRRGSLTAVRHFDTNADRARWLVRCDCGNYEIHRIAAWFKHASDKTACQVCMVKRAVLALDTNTGD